MTCELPARITPMNIRTEVDLLLSCARTHIDHEQDKHIGGLLCKDVDWGYLMGTAHRHGVMPLLYRSLSTYMEAVPKDVFDQIYDHFQTNAYRNHFLTDELLKLLDLFKTHRIQAIPYKGPVLAAVVYKDLSLRQCSDLDILIQEQDVPLAKDLLLSQRYQPDPVHQLEWEAHFVHDNAMFLVDLHWGITGRNVSQKRDASFAIDIEGLWERLEPIYFAGATVAHFSPEDLLMIRCQDAVKEYWKDGWPQLKWICDVAEIINAHQGMDWEQVMAQAKKLGNQRLLFLCLSLSSDLLGTALPEIVLQRIQADSQVSSLAMELCELLFHETQNQNRFLDRQRGFLARNLFCARLKERLQDRIPYYLRILREYRNNVRRAIKSKEDRELLLLPESLSFLFYPLAFLYYLLRPIWRVGRYGLRRFNNLL